MSKIKKIIIITLSAFVVITTAIAESEIPRQADISIVGIFLNNPESVQKVLGSLPATFEPADQLPMVQICNSEINEILTLYFHHGDIAGSFNEFSVTTAARKPNNCISLKLSGHFVSGKGIRLGIKKKRLIEILGPEFTEKQKGKEVVLNYRIEGLENSQFLKKYNLPVYYGSYHFKKDKLIAFKFGFEYP